MKSTFKKSERSQKTAAKKIIIKVLSYFPENSYSRNAMIAMVQDVALRKNAFHAVEELISNKKIVLVSAERYGIKK
jgi:hypothetical protein